MASDFNSHAHVERDCLSLVLLIVDSISTHTLTWSVTKTCTKFDTTKFHFNSHAHVERDCNVATLQILFVISTHTLTWSVTIGTFIGSYSGFISTHTLTWSVTS